MAVSFACPACKTLIQVGEEMSGQTGQCPRCERLLIIPSASVPIATLLDADGKPVPAAPPTPARKPTPKIIDNDPPRSPRRSVERKPAGPSWPWTVGILGGIVVFILLFSSFITLFAYRPRQETTNLIVVHQKPWHIALDGVTHGRLEGNVAILERGEIFQIRGRFTEADFKEAGWAGVGFPTRRFTVNLDPAKSYVMEMDSKQLSSHIQLENNFAGAIHSVGQKGVPNAAIRQPALLWGNPYVVQISCTEEGALGDFTLTIRQDHIPKPIE